MLELIVLFPACSGHQYKYIFCWIFFLVLFIPSFPNFDLLFFPCSFSWFYKSPLSPKNWNYCCLVDTDISSLMHTDHKVLHKAATKLFNPMPEVEK